MATIKRPSLVKLNDTVELHNLETSSWCKICGHNSLM